LHAQRTPTDPLDPKFQPSIDEETADYPGNVWVTGSLAKVHQDNASPGNVKWALVSAARNEFVSIQVHEHAGTNPISLNVKVSDLVNAQTGTRLSSSVNIIVYREAYVNIVRPSDSNGSTGYTPDILIPTVDPYWRQARNAFPFTIGANQTQSIWFDIFVPPTTPSGFYQGTITIINGGSTYVTIPVVLSVWDFALPSTATLRSTYGTSWDASCVGLYGGYDACSSYPGAKNGDSGAMLSDIDTAVMMLDHRVSDGSSVYPPLVAPPNDWTTLDSQYGPLLSGARAHTSGILKGASLTSLNYTPTRDSHIDAANLRDWMKHFSNKGWLSALFAYSCDEPPSGCAWSAINAHANSITGYSSIDPHMPALVTTSISKATAHGVSASINLMVVQVNEMDPQSGGNQRSTYNAWLSSVPGNQVWMYQSCSSHGSCSNDKSGDARSTWPSYMIDASPVRNRIMQWVEYLNNVSGDLYYEIDYCWVYTCEDGRGNKGKDPWVYEYCFGGNGDGTLIYPGPISKVGGKTPIPLPSIRLKNIRDGMQDYEYLIALSNAGYGSFAAAEGRSFITNAYTYNNDPAALLNVRAALGYKLHQLALATPRDR
jgi:hypothetical protein